MLLLLPLLAPGAFAADTWTDVRPGVAYLRRTNGEPQDIHAVRIDLTVPNVGLHASSDARGTERGVPTSTFARNADVLVAINADWSDGSTPVGLAISDGWPWHDHIGDDTLGSRWGYFACTATKTCTIDHEQPLDVAWWFTSPTLPPYRYFQAVGANSQLLLRDGAALSGCYDSARNPRSAVCLEADGTHLWLVVVDGRSSRAAGMTCDETRSLLLDLGCHDAAMLDGGGSSTLVVDGDVKNDPSDGSPRTVANHIGIVYSDTLDARCEVSSGRWCAGSVLATCQGGRYLGSGDCAAYGAGCEEDGDYAYCVDYRCPDGEGQGAACVDGTVIATCADGQYATGDCGAFGLACGADAEGAACMDARCAAGPHSSFCTDAGQVGACTDGVYAESACAAGAHCGSDAAGVYCADDRCPEDDGGACVGEVWQACARGVYAEVDCAAAGTTCDPASGCVGLADPDDTGPGADPSDPDPTRPEARVPGERTLLSDLGCGCDAGGTPARVGLVGVGLLMALRRRRTPADGPAA